MRAVIVNIAVESCNCHSVRALPYFIGVCYMVHVGVFKKSEVCSCILDHSQVQVIRMSAVFVFMHRLSELLQLCHSKRPCGVISGSLQRK